MIIYIDSLQNPLAILSPLYQSEYYHLSLLHNEIKEIKNILSEESVMKIIERRESCEMLKKIISYFLNFIVKNNGERICNFTFFKLFIVNSLNCLKPIEISNNEALLKIQQSRAKMKTISSTTSPSPATKQNSQLKKRRRLQSTKLRQPQTSPQSLLSLLYRQAALSFPRRESNLTVAKY